MDSEHQQVLIRVGFAVLILLWVLFRVWAGAPSPEAGRVLLVFSAGYLIGSLMLLAHLRAAPAVNPRRRYVAMGCDLVLLPAGMIAGGDLTALLYPLFLWITLGMGLRYGVGYLFASAGLSVAGFAVVIASTPYWRDQPVLSFGLLLALAALPLYVSRLLPRADGGVGGAGASCVEGRSDAVDAAQGCQSRPPIFAKKLLLMLLPRKAIGGDLEEDHRQIVAEFGKSFADRWYWNETFRAIFGHSRFVRWVVLGGGLAWITDLLSRW